MGVFMSYSSRDKETVTRLTQDLQDADEHVWLDQRLAGGDAWWRAILEQIRGCDVFVFALSQNSIQSKPWQAELRYAQDLKLPILPVQVGPVDSMQLNPLATVQTVDYRTSTSTAAMRLLSALNRARTQRQPLPSELPPEPSVPFEYLIRLYTTIANPDYLSPPDQATLVAQLQFGLREDGDHDAARNDIVMLLSKLRGREDVTYRTRTDVDAILASVEAEAHLDEGVSQPPGSVAPMHPVSSGSTATLADRPTGAEATTAERIAVPQQTSQRQTDTAPGPEKHPSQSGWRSSKKIPILLTGMAVIAAILSAFALIQISLGYQRQKMRLPEHYWMPYYVHGAIYSASAVALIIAVVVVVLVRRKAVYTPERVPPGR